MREKGRTWLKKGSENVVTGAPISTRESLAPQECPPESTLLVLIWGLVLLYWSKPNVEESLLPLGMTTLWPVTAEYPGLRMRTTDALSQQGRCGKAATWHAR